jgi:hypothetical protein
LRRRRETPSLETTGILIEREEEREGMFLDDHGGLMEDLSLRE